MQKINKYQNLLVLKFNFPLKLFNLIIFKLFSIFPVPSLKVFVVLTDNNGYPIFSNIEFKEVLLHLLLFFITEFFKFF